MGEGKTLIERTRVWVSFQRTKISEWSSDINAIVTKYKMPTIMKAVFPDESRLGGSRLGVSARKQFNLVDRSICTGVYGFGASWFFALATTKFLHLILKFVHEKMKV